MRSVVGVYTDQNHSQNHTVQQALEMRYVIPTNPHPHDFVRALPPEVMTLILKGRYKENIKRREGKRSVPDTHSRGSSGIVDERASKQCKHYSAPLDLDIHRFFFFCHRIPQALQYSCCPLGPFLHSDDTLVPQLEHPLSRHTSLLLLFLLERGGRFGERVGPLTAAGVSWVYNPSSSVLTPACLYCGAFGKQSVCDR